jgi:pimeloyl-ACP methyl ester carboxylesterase
MALHNKEPLHGNRSAARPLSPALQGMRFLFATLGVIMPGLMGRWACRLWFRTRRYPESAACKRVADAAVHETLQVDGIQVAVYSWGAGPLVLFMHGWSGRGSHAAAFVGPLTAAGYRVIAVDAPGHGASPGDSTNILECAALLQALVRRYGPFHAAITHSFGGMVLAYALHAGMALQRAVCIGTPATIGFLLDSFTQTLAMPDAVVKVLRQRLEQRFQGDLDARISTVSNVGGLAVAALIVHDADDASVPWQHGQMIAAAWPGAKFLKTSGLGHGRILRDKAVVRAAVDFISQ